MRKPDIFIVDGRAHSWRQLCELRRRQLEAWEAARPSQPTLFALKEDHRPASERTGAGRLTEPTLMEWIARKPS